MTTTTLAPTAAILASTRSVRSGLPATLISEALAVLAARTAVALDASLTRFLAATDQNLGHLETEAAHAAQELLRPANQRAAQAKADAAPRRTVLFRRAVRNHHAYAITRWLGCP